MKVFLEIVALPVLWLVIGWIFLSHGCEAAIGEDK
jgi:hypothetical protein